MNRQIVATNLNVLQVLFDQNLIHIHQFGSKEKKVEQTLTKLKFIFSTLESIEKQIIKFQLLVNLNQWDGCIAFLAFKAAFKYEYWSLIENALRKIQGSMLKKLTFIDTKIENEHLGLLLSLIQWIQPKDLKLKFKQNEIDDGEFEYFIMEVLTHFNPNIQSVEVISNPGVFKGHMLSRISKTLTQLNMDQIKYQFHFLRNKFTKSFAYFRKPANESQQNIDSTIAHIQYRLQESFFFKLHVRSCFTESNNEGLFALINESYNNVKLEQIEILDISESILEETANFEKFCQKISTSKGLLSLAISKMPVFQKNEVLQQLMGDRYDQLRLNHLDFSENQDFDEQCIQSLANNLFANSLKTMEFKGSFNQTLPTIQKLVNICNSIIRANKQLMKDSIKEGYLKKQSLRELDLSSMENFHRHDLSQKILGLLVFNEHSSIKRIVFQNMNTGRAQNYLQAINTYKNQILIMIQTHPNLYLNYKPKLCSLTIPQQTYEIEGQTWREICSQILFTVDSDLFNITKICLKGCFDRKRSEGFMAFLHSLRQIYLEKPQIKYTLKILDLELPIYDEVADQIFEFIIFNSHFELETLNLDGGTIIASRFVNIAQKYLVKLQQDMFFNLKHFSLKNISGELDIFAIIDLLVFNEKIKLDTLEIIKLNIKDNEEMRLNLLEKSQNPNLFITLQNLSIGFYQYGKDEIDSALIAILVLNKNSVISKLEMHQLQLKNGMINIFKKYQNMVLQGFKPLQNLKNLSVCINQDYNDGWKNFNEIFIFNDFVFLQTLEFQDTTISKEFIRVFEEGKEKRISKMLNLQQEHQKFHLSTLIFKSCIFQGDFLSLFFTSVMCKIEKLHIIDCNGIELAIKELQQKYEATKQMIELITVSLKEFTLDGTLIQNIEIFEWFLKHIILKKERQRMEKISFQGCNLKSEHMKIISHQISELKIFQLEKKIKRYFSLREFNFQNNSDINTKQWISFFKTIFSVYDASLDEEDDEEDKNELDKQTKTSLKLKNQQSVDLGLLKMDLKNQISNVTTQYLFDKKLNLDYKMVDINYPLDIKVPSQLKEISLNLQFKDDPIDVRKELYQRLIKGLVFFPQSNVHKCTFNNLDIKLFMYAIEHAISYASKFQQQFESKEVQTLNIKLKIINLISIQNASEKLVQRLANFFFGNRYFNLEAFKLEDLSSGNIYNNICMNIKHSIQSGIKPLLQKLYLTDVQGILNQNETQQFFETIVLNKLVPLEVLHINNGIEMHLDQKSKNKLQNFLQNQDSLITLKDFKFLSDLQSTQQSLATVIPLLINSKYINLDKLNTSNSSDISQKQLIGVAKSIEEHNFTSLTDITLLNYSNLGPDEFKLFYYIRKKLRNLTLQQLNLDIWGKKEIQSFIDIQTEKLDQQQKYQNCKLDISIKQNDEGNEMEILDKFVFSRLFNWDQIVLNSYQTFGVLAETPVQFNLSLANQYLKILRLNCNLIHSDQAQLSEAALKIIGEKFIYNENSCLQEIILHQCHLKPSGIQALVSSAQNFRDKVIANNQIKSMQLQLKRFSLYYSQYLLQEGNILIGQNIIFFEYITIERFELEECCLDNTSAISFCKAAKKWLKFQRRKERKCQLFQIQNASWGRNEFVTSEEAWNLICATFIFTDNTPFLKNLNLHFMAISDLQVEWICQKASDYFLWKPDSYVHPLKQLNFMLNTAITEIGWTELSEKFFFHQNIKLEQLNLMAVNLNTEKKIHAIQDVMIRRAQEEVNQKLSLHTLLTTNIQIKSQLMKYMSPKPLNYEPYDDTMVEIYDCSNFGLISGLPLSFGERTAVITKTIYESETYVNQEFMEDENSVRISQYHLDIVQGFLKPLNELFKRELHLNNSLPISFKSIDQLATFFKYRTQDGDPYPISLFFNTLAIQYYHTSQSSIRSINFIGDTLNHAELCTQFHIFQFWKELKNQNNSFDQILIEYKMDDDLVDLMLGQGYNEKDIVDLIRFLPPSTMRFKNSLSLQAIKGIYSIMWDNYQFNYSNIQIDKHIALNAGIGYSIREYVYNSNSKNFFTLGMKRFAYLLLSLFVTPAPQYMFTEQIKDLNKYLSSQSMVFWILIFLTIIYYLVCCFASYYFTQIYGLKLEDSLTNLDFNQICYNGPHIYGLYTYGVFAFISFIFEGYIYANISSIIPNHITGLIPTKALQQPVQQEQKVIIIADQSFQHDLNTKTNQVTNLPPQKISLIDQKKLDKLKLTVSENMNILAKSQTVKYAGYLKEIVLGQLLKFDLFNDISFIITCYYCQFQNLFNLALIVITINISFNMFNLTRFLVKRIQKNTNNKQISSNYINDFFSVSLIGRNQAIANVLDTVAPFNANHVPNNFLTRMLMPQLAGRGINKNILAYLFKFAFEDLPQALLQIYFLLDVSIKSQQGIPVTTWVTIISSVFSLCLSFIKYIQLQQFKKRFMSIRPSTLSQVDFDQLAEEKIIKFQDFDIAELKKEQEIIKALTDVKLNEKEIPIEINDEQLGLLKGQIS